jgi:hypothetical protein
MSLPSSLPILLLFIRSSLFDRVTLQLRTSLINFLLFDQHDTLDTTLSEPASYHDVILHPEWQHGIAEDIAALERTDTWDLVPCPPRVRLITCKWVYRFRLALVVLLCAIKLISLLVVFNGCKVVIMVRLLLLLLI